MRSPLNVFFQKRLDILVNFGVVGSSSNKFVDEKFNTQPSTCAKRVVACLACGWFERRGEVEILSVVSSLRRTFRVSHIVEDATISDFDAKTGPDGSAAIVQAKVTEFYWLAASSLVRW